MKSPWSLCLFQLDRYVRVLPRRKWKVPSWKAVKISKIPWTSNVKILNPQMEPLLYWRNSEANCLWPHLGLLGRGLFWIFVYPYFCDRRRLHIQIKTSATLLKSKNSGFKKSAYSCYSGKFKPNESYQNFFFYRYCQIATCKSELKTTRIIKN